MKTQILLAAACLAVPSSASATEFVVDRDDDAEVADCTAAANDCTLRGAIVAASATFDEDVVRLDGRRVELVEALPALKYVATVAGGGGTIDAKGTAPTVLRTSDDSETTIRDLTVTGARGDADSDWGAGIVLGDHGVLDHVTVVDNDATGVQASSDGATITDSVIARNRGFGAGGLLSGGGFLTLIGTTVAGNTAAAANGTPALAGGVLNQGFLFLEHVTIAGNRATGPGLPLGREIGGVDQYGPMIRMQSSIVAGDGPVCGASARSFGHNVVTDGSCRLDDESDRVGADARLGAADDGGRLPLLEGSPAIDIGGDCAAPQGRACDAGALESPFTAPVPVEPSPSPAPTAAPPASTPAPASADRTAPKVTVAPLKKVTRKRLRRGLAVTVTADEPVIGVAELLVRGKVRAVAPSFDRAATQRLVLRARGRVRRATVRVTAYDDAANRATASQSFSVR